MKKEPIKKLLIRYVVEKAIETTDSVDYNKGFHSCFVDQISKFIDDFLQSNQIEDACGVTITEYAEVEDAVEEEIMPIKPTEQLF